MAMIHWMCIMSTEGKVRSDSLLEKLDLDNLVVVLCSHRLHWVGQDEHIDGFTKLVYEVMVEDKIGRG